MLTKKDMIKPLSDDEFEPMLAVLMDYYSSAVEVRDIYDKLETYVTLMHSWNVIHNISSSKNKPSDWWENLYDSVAMILREKSLKMQLSKRENYVLDAGAGGGFPGIPLAIIFKQTKFFLVDVNRKKCSFLRTVKAKLELSNVTVINKKLEDMSPASLVITKAAFAPIHAGVLAQSTSAKGHIIIWSTPMMAKEFMSALEKYNCSLASQYDYALPSEKKRSLLVFLKG